MRNLKKIAERIDEKLTEKTDECSAYENGRMPILDLKVWLGMGL